MLVAQFGPAYPIAMRQRVRQEIAFSSARLGGCRTVANLFRLRPIHADALTLDAAIGHHPFLLEYRYAVPDAADTPYNPELPPHVLEPMLDDEAAAPVRKWILLTLGVFCTARIFQYARGPAQQEWFVAVPSRASTPEKRVLPQWGQAGYHHKGIGAWILDDFSEADFEPIPEVPTSDYYRLDHPQQYLVGMTPDRFQLPDRIDDFFERFNGLHTEDRLSFLSACFLFDKSIDLFWQAPSLAFAASVSSLETLIAADHRGESVETCTNCGQPRYSVRQKFLEFIKVNGSDSPEARKLAGRIYERRSKVLHEGQLIPGEAKPRTIDGSIEWISDDDSRRGVIRFFRSCILNWLILHSRDAKKAL